MRNYKSIYILIFSAVCLFFNSSVVQSQSILLNQSHNNLAWGDLILKIEKDYDCRIFYLLDSVPSSILIFDEETIHFSDLMIRHRINVSYAVNGNVFLTNQGFVKSTLSEDFFNPDEKNNLNEKISTIKENFLETNNEYVHEEIVIGSIEKSKSNKIYTIYGFVKNKEDGEPVIGGTIYIKELKKGVVTTPTGHFSVEVYPGEYTFEVSSIGRKLNKKHLKVLSGGQLNIQLEQELVALDEVVVTADRYDNVKNNKLGFEKIPIKNIREIPAILGERDVLKVALMLPGIQNTGEGASGFNVRGSPADQNLFYINDVPLYNTSHLFGFFSVFNSDAVSDFAIYKGHIPVNHGGRLASIFEVTTKNGNNQKFSARGGISPITGKILLEGPVVKDKVSCLVALRTTYSDWLLNLVKDPDIRNSKAQFQDGLMNMTFDLSPIDKIMFFAYRSYDNVNLGGHTRYDYYNRGYSLRWNHIVKQKHSLNASLVSANYGYSEENNEVEIISYYHDYEIKHNEAKLNLEIRPNSNHTLIVGTNTILYNLNRGKHLPLAENSSVNPVNLGKEKGLESAIYAGEDWNISNRLSISIGLRMNYYSSLGNKTVYQYAIDAPRTINNIIDTVSYGNNEVVKGYINPDYRLAAKYLLTNNTSIKASYNKLHQNIFMLSNTISISPTDQWKLSDKHIHPVKGEQYSFGFYQKLFRQKADFSIETYYKQVNNLVEYKAGADFLVNEIIETDVLQGNLTSYGVELSVKKPIGRINGWLNYVYSRSTIQVDSDIEENKINFGKKYPANYEKPHSLNLVANYKFNRRVSFSTNLVYSTGRPITYPTATYVQGETMVLHYSNRNEYRIPDYFRIDASLSVEGNLHSKKFAHSSWMFSIYNLTGRKNAYSVFFKNDGNAIKGYKFSIFGSPIFTITYNFKLGNYAS